MSIRTTDMLRAMESGFRTDVSPVLHYAAFGEVFHGATLDMRRRGTLESYL